MNVCIRACMYKCTYVYDNLPTITIQSPPQIASAAFPARNRLDIDGILLILSKAFWMLLNLHILNAYISVMKMSVRMYVDTYVYIYI